MPRQDTDTAETAVVMQFLHPSQPMASAALHATIHERDVTPSDIDAAVASLVQAGVIEQDGDGLLRGSPALQRLDQLGLISP